MTIDKVKLKALAEAATPGRHYDRLESAGGGIKYECTGDDGSLVLKVDHKNNEFGFVGDRGEADEAFFLACSPATVLALLAEIDRLSPPAGQVPYQQQMEAWKSASNQDLRARAELMIQVEELEAENEALRSLKLPHYLKLSDEMRAAGEHAEQRAREDQCCSVPILKAVFFEAAIQRWLDDQEEAIDAAMAKEASHG